MVNSRVASYDVCKQTWALESKEPLVTMRLLMEVSQRSVFCVLFNTKLNVRASLTIILSLSLLWLYKINRKS